MILSPYSESHQNRVLQVLTQLLEHQLFVKAEGCEFHSSTISFLRYVIAAGEIKMDPEKVRAVTEWPTPTSIRGRFSDF